MVENSIGQPPIDPGAMTGQSKELNESTVQPVEAKTSAELGEKAAIEQYQRYFEAINSLYDDKPDLAKDNHFALDPDVQNRVAFDLDDSGNEWVTIDKRISGEKPQERSQSFSFTVKRKPKRGPVEELTFSVSPTEISFFGSGELAEKSKAFTTGMRSLEGLYLRMTELARKYDALKQLR